MASLQNAQIDQSYQGLIKTADNTAGIPFPPAKLQFGDGTDFPIEIGDLSAFGAGTFIALKSGTGSIQLDGNSFSIVSSGGTISPTGGAVTLVDGTFNFGAGFPGAAATNVDFTNATVTGLPSSGGGADTTEGQAITPALATNVYNMPWILNGYNISAGRSMDANKLQLIPFYANPGETIGEFYVRVQTAQPGATMNIGLYKSYVSTGLGFKTTMPEYVGDIATGVDVSTTGKKSFTGLNLSLPADAVGGCYWIAFQSDTAAVALTKWTNWVAAERVISSDIYRVNGVVKDNATFALPTGQIDLSSGVTNSTDLPIDFAWRYKS